MSGVVVTERFGVCFSFLLLFPSGRVIGSYYVDEDVSRGCFNFASMQVLR